MNKLIEKLLNKYKKKNIQVVIVTLNEKNEVEVNSNTQPISAIALMKMAQRTVADHISKHMIQTEQEEIH